MFFREVMIVSGHVDLVALLFVMSSFFNISSCAVELVLSNTGWSNLRSSGQFHM